MNWREFEAFKQKAKDLARAGKFAIHINASGNDYMSKAFDVRLEPYEIAARWGAVPSSTAADQKQISSYPLGSRQLTVLALAVEAAIGKEGMNKMHVVLTARVSSIVLPVCLRVCVGIISPGRSLVVSIMSSDPLSCVYCVRIPRPHRSRRRTRRPF